MAEHEHCAECGVRLGRWEAMWCWCCRRFLLADRRNVR